MAALTFPASTTETTPAGTLFLNRVWRLWRHSWPLSRRTAALLASLLAAYSAALVCLGALHTDLFGHDYFVFLDAGWRVLNGQRPHIDFHTAYGPVLSLYSAFAMWSGRGNVSAGFGVARALASAVFTIWSFTLLRRRAAPAAAVATAFLIALLAGAPYALTSSPFTQSMAMFYNRFGYVLLALVMLESFRPAAPSYPGGVSTGLAIGLLLFLKFTFFGISLGFAALSLLTKPPGARRLAGILTGFLLLCACFLIWLGFDIRAIVTDIRMAAAGGSSSFPMHRFVRTLNESFLGMLITLALGTIVTALNWNTRPTFPERIQPLLLAGLTVMAEPAVSITNQQNAIPILMSVSCLLFLASLTHTAGKAAPEARPLIGALLMLGLCLPATVCAYDMAGLGHALLHGMRHRGAPEIPRLDAPALSSLIFEAELPGEYQYESGAPMVEMVNDGIHLLRANTAASDRVLTLGYINPFPVCLRRPAPRGSSISFWLGYNISAGNYLPPSQLFAEADAVMIPAFESQAKATTDAMVAQYRPVLQQNYEFQARSQFWILYLKRKTGPVAFLIRRSFRIPKNLPGIQRLGP
jgi:hypothetical protein